MASDFLTTYTPLANDIATATGLDPSVVLGIIDTETGGGQHVNGNNIFGISPGGKVASYKDVETGSQAFVDLMKSGRYAGVAGAGNPAAQAQALVKAGYNTANPNYAAIVARKAAGFGSQLGYQDNKAAASAAAPTSAKDQLLTELGGDQKQPPAAPAAGPAAGPDAGKPKSAKDQLLEELSQPDTAEQKPTASETPAVDEYGRPLPTVSPAAQPVTAQSLRSSLEPTPGTWYGDVMPVAQTPAEAKADTFHFAMPNALRSPLLGAAKVLESGADVGTVDPIKGTYGADPDVVGLGVFAANPLRFGGPQRFGEVPYAPLSGVNALDQGTLIRSQLRDITLPEGPAPRMATDVPTPSTPMQRSLPKPVEPAQSSPTTVGSGVGGTPTTAAEAQAVASAHYKVAEQSGGTLPPSFTNNFIDTVQSKLPQTEAGKAVVGDSEVTALKGRLDTLRDKPLSVQDVQEMDQGLSKLIDKQYGPKGLSAEGHDLVDLQQTLRNQIDDVSAADVPGGKTGFDALVQARKAWQQFRKMDDVERMQQRAAMTQVPDTAFRTQVKNLVTNNARKRGWSDAEISALKSAADSGTIGGVLHMLGSGLVPHFAAVASAAAGGGLHGYLWGYGIGKIGSGLARAGENALLNRRQSRLMGTLGSSVPPMPTNPLNMP